MLEPSDRSLIAAARRGDAAAFGELYRRHRDVMLAFFLDRTGDCELAADLTAETFAAALDGCHRYRADSSPASWLFATARRVLAVSRSRGVVDRRARRRLGVPRLELDAGDLDRIASLRRLLPDSTASPGGAPSAGRREAMRARVLDELEQPRALCALRRSGAIGRSGKGRSS